MRIGWTREEVHEGRHKIMKSIHSSRVGGAETCGPPGNYVNGANIAGSKKVADSMPDQCLV